jgi:hypothetical protein
MAKATKKESSKAAKRPKPAVAVKDLPPKRSKPVKGGGIILQRQH